MIDCTIAVAERLRTHAGESFASVGLLASFAALDGLPRTTPAAYVLPLRIDAEDNSVITGVTQTLTLTFGVLLLARHAGDASGAKATEQLEALRSAAAAALVAWTPEGCLEPIQFAGGEIVQADAGLVVWRDDFVVTRLASFDTQT